LIYGKDLENVALTGRGTIDGQGGAFPVTTRKKPDRYRNRPYGIRLIRCRNVLVEGLTLRNSAMWMQHYFECDRVAIRGITVFNHSNMNNDMIDIDGCRDVTVSDCVGDTDDDAITLKSTSERICENVTITNCVVSSHCNAIKCGTESSGGFRNITISNVVVRPSAANGVIFGSKNGTGGITLAMVDGGVLEGIVLSNIRIDGPRVPLFLRLGDRGRGPGGETDRRPVGSAADITISNVVATGADRIGCSITGLPGHPIQRVRLSGIRISFEGGVAAEDAPSGVHNRPDEYPEGTMFGVLPAYGLTIRHAEDIQLRDVTLTTEGADGRPAVFADTVGMLGVNGLRGGGTRRGSALIRLRDVRDAEILASRPLAPVRAFLLVEGADSRGIRGSGNYIGEAEIPVEYRNGARGTAVDLR
jgi:hypothetical protein